MPFNPGRRRSERFAELLDESDSRLRRHRRSAIDDELAPLAKLAARVGTAADNPEVAPDFRSGLRSMLMATIEREGVGAVADEKTEQASNRAALAATTEVVRQVRRGRPGRSGGTGRTRAAAIVGVMAGALALSGVSAASTNSLPGDPLYQVKRSTEKAQLALAGSDQSRGRLFLDLAFSRVREAQQVDPGRAGAVLLDMDDETYAGVALLNRAAAAGDLTVTDSIRSFVAAQRTELAAFARATSNAAAVRRSTGILDDVVARLDAITAALAKGCGFDPPDGLGPVPNC
jgi:hypothetical protein